MQTLTETQPKINTPAWPDWYVAGVADDALAAAEVYFVEHAGLPWQTVCEIYLTVFGKAENVDLSATVIPAAPEINEWLASLEVGDLEDRLTAVGQQWSGIPAF